MGLGKKIAYYRKNKNMTQEELAKQLGISNQAVSKWENEQSCPDVELLPKIADIFEITLDELFERDFVPHKESEESLGVSEAPMTECKENPALTGARPEVLNAPVLYTDSVGLPWKDDETLHAALYIGHRLVRGEDIRKRFGRICKTRSARTAVCGRSYRERYPDGIWQGRAVLLPQWWRCRWSC